MRHQHPALSFSLELPAGAAVPSDLPTLITLAPVRTGGRVPTVTVSSEGLPEDVAAEEWIESALARQRATLESTLIDRHPLAGVPAGGVRTLSSIVRGSAVGVLDQWWHGEPDRGWTMTASCDALDYAQLVEPFEKIADSFEWH